MKGWKSMSLKELLARHEFRFKKRKILLQIQEY